MHILYLIKFFLSPIELFDNRMHIVQIIGFTTCLQVDSFCCFSKQNKLSRNQKVNLGTLMDKARASSEQPAVRINSKLLLIFFCKIVIFHSTTERM